MREVEILAPAKINLSLDVIGRRPDGYHTLCMLMQTVSLYDTVRLQKRNNGISLEISMEENTPTSDPATVGEIPADARNLCWQAAAAFLDRVSESNGGVHITLTKRIPAAAGLAGGSADAAAVLRGMNELWGNPLSEKQLADLALPLGADIPYCLHGGTCRAEGIGEILTPLPSFAGHWLVLVKPPISVSTPWVFSKYRETGPGEHPDTGVLEEAITSGDIHTLASGMLNVLERVTETAHPEVAALRERLLELGALGSRMSGSGPSVFGLFGEEASARAAWTALKPEYPASWVLRTVNG